MSHSITSWKYVPFYLLVEKVSTLFIGQKSVSQKYVRRKYVRRKYVRRKYVRRKNVLVPLRHKGPRVGWGLDSFENSVEGVIRTYLRIRR